MAPDTTPPRFLSLAFHTRFFPRLLWKRLRRMKSQGQGTSFTSTMGMMILLTVCLILAVVGIPLAWTQGSIMGWILSILGLGGGLALFIASVAAYWGNRPTYDDFLVGIFFLLVSMGVFIGIPVGMDKHSPWLGALTSAGGLIAGYAVGILAGLRLQHLGWIVIPLNMLAGLAAIMTGGAFLIMLVALMVG